MNDLWLARISSLSNEVGLYVVLLEVLLFMPNSLIRHSKQYDLHTNTILLEALSAGTITYLSWREERHLAASWSLNTYFFLIMLNTLIAHYTYILLFPQNIDQSDLLHRGIPPSLDSSSTSSLKYVSEINKLCML